MSNLAAALSPKDSVIFLIRKVRFPDAVTPTSIFSFSQLLDVADDDEDAVGKAARAAQIRRAILISAKKDPGTFVFGSDPKKTDDGPPKNFFTSRTDAEAFLSAAGFSNKDTAYLLDGITSYEVIKPPHQFK